MSTNTKFACADLTGGQLNAIVKKLGGYDGALKFLRGETVVAEPNRSWREQDGVIYFSVTSDGTTGEEWIKRLEDKSISISDEVRGMLRSRNFKPTLGVTTGIAVLKGMLFENFGRITKRIREFAAERELGVPNVEVNCLIRDKFSDDEIEAMGLFIIITMHEPIYFDGDPRLLSVCCGEVGDKMYTSCGDPGFMWDRSHGFAFSVPLGSSQH